MNMQTAKLATTLLKVTQLSFQSYSDSMIVSLLKRQGSRLHEVIWGSILSSPVAKLTILNFFGNGDD
jgi:hypothetical protein